MIRLRLAKLSVCECGFPLLDESIQLGTEYLSEETDRIHATLTCGGCHKEIELIAVRVYARGASQGGYIPADVFEEA